MVAVTVVLVLALMLMSSVALAIMGKLFYVLFWLVKITLIFGLFMALINNVWVYKAVGFTPISIIMGDKIYGPSLKVIEKKPAGKLKKKSTKVRKTSPAKKRSLQNEEA